MEVPKSSESSTKSLSNFSPFEFREELNKRLQKEEAIGNVKSLIEVGKSLKKRKNLRDGERSTVENATEYKTRDND